MAYLGDPYKSFGDFANGEYANGLKGRELSFLAERNSKFKPAGLQGYGADGVPYPSEAISRLAERNAGVKPAGLQGYENYNPMSELEGQAREMSQSQLSKLAIANMNKSPAGGSGFGGLDISQASRLAQRDMNVAPAGGSLGSLDISQASRLAQRDMNVAPAGGSLGGLDISQASRLAQRDMNVAPAGGSMGLGNDDAFEGYEPSLEIIKAAQRDMKQKPAGLQGLGDEDNFGSWVTFFNMASNAMTDTDILTFLRKAIESVPDNTPPEVKKEYYDVAMQMLHRRKKTTLRHMDIQRIELESNLGWLVNPNLVPKTGGFGKAVGRAIGAVGSIAAKNTKSHYDMQRLLADGDKLKTTLRKTGSLFDGLGDTLAENKTLVLLLAGAGVAAAYWYFCKKKKK